MRAKTKNPNAHRLIEPINGHYLEELVANAAGTVDASGSESEVVRITPDKAVEKARMEKNLKMNILNAQMEMDAKRSLVEDFHTLMQSEDEKAEIGRTKALQNAL